MESCIARIAAINPAVNAIVATDFERAMDAAKAADAVMLRGEKMGPLHGLPLGIKDLEDVAGLRTTYGSPLFADHVPTTDQGIVRRLKAAGGIVLGKTNTPEFGAGANTRNVVYGATGNAFDPTRSAAGSSGGSAVALATNMVMLASGSDTGGSLRNPAAFNGIVGFRPSSGLVANEKRGLGWSNLPSLGPMARTVGDLCLMLSCMVEDDAADPLASPIGSQAARVGAGFAVPGAVDLSSLRVALSPDFGFAPTEVAIRAVFAEKTGLFRHFFARADDATPDCSGMDETFAVLRALGFVAAHAAKVASTPEMVGPNVRVNVAEGLAYSAADIAQAMAMQTTIYRRFQAFFAEYDVMLTPAVTISPRPWRELYPTEIDGVPTKNYFHWLALAYAPTVVGHPAISLPLGRDQAGMPFGLQIVGRRGGDAQVLAVAAALEDLLARDERVMRPVPDLKKLRKAAPISESEAFKAWG
jgi:Asp-tRNA(Asn)/Glu-tRNA(Gln) amidotransferase A subunit family amidase